MLLAIDSPANGGVTLTQVKGWLFHVDFATPGNSTFGVGANHSPNAAITVNPFVDAFTDAAGFTIVPQQGTADRIQTLGDKIMTPVVYQNRGGTESLWAIRPLCVTFPHRTDWCSLVSIRCHRRHISRHPCATANLDQWRRRVMALYAQHSRRSKRQHGHRLLPHPAPTMFPGIRYAGRLGS